MRWNARASWTTPVRSTAYALRVPDDPETARLTLFVWAAWGFAALVVLLLLTLLAGGWWVTSRRVLVDFARARAAGDLWAPLMRDEGGEWGRIVRSQKQSAFRAESRGDARDLWLRWGPLLVLHGLLTLVVVGAIVWLPLSLVRVALSL